MPQKKAIKQAKEDKTSGKAPTTQAGNFVREEMDEFKKGKGPAKSPKQAIAIGLSESRRAGVKLPPPPEKGTAKKKAGAKQKSGTKKKSA